MAETIRDVIIRVAVKQVDSTLRVPDLKPVVDAQREATTGATNLTNSVTNVTNTFDHSKTIINEAAKSVRALGDDSLLVRLRKIEESIKGIGDRSGETAQKAGQATASTFQLSNVGDKLKATGEGALHLAKGIGFITAANEEEIAQVLKMVALAEGTFSAFKGGVELYKNLSDLLPIVRAGVQGVTTAETARGVASTAASTASVAGLRAVSAALGPLAIIGAIGGAAYLAFGQMRSGASDAGKEIDDLRGKLEKSTDALVRMRNEQLGGEADPFGKVRAGVEREVSERALAVAENLSVVRRGAVADRERELLAAEGMLSAEQELARLTAERNQLAARARAPGLGEEEQTAFIERAKAIDEQRLRILERQGEQLRRNKEEQQAAIDAAREALRNEENRLRSLDEIVGRMSQIDRLEFTALGKRAKGGGQLNAGELTRIEQLGGAGTAEFVSGQFAGLGRQAGGADLFAPFAGRAQRGAGSEVENIKEQLRILTDQENGRLTPLVEATRAIEENAKERKKVMDDLVRVLRVEVAGKREVEDLRAQVVAVQEKLRNAGLKGRFGAS